MSLRDAMEAAGIKPSAAVGVSVINDHAMALIKGLLEQHRGLRADLSYRGSNIHIAFYEADGTLAPHAIVLDQRGTWHAKTYVVL